MDSADTELLGAQTVGSGARSKFCKVGRGEGNCFWWQTVGIEVRSACIRSGCTLTMIGSVAVMVADAVAITK